MSLDIAVGKEFDYLVPAHLSEQVQVGSRVRVPFGPRQVLGCVTALAGQSARQNLRPVLGVLGTASLVTPEVLALARWMADYYCCPLETALKSVVPEAVRREEAGWRERLIVRPLAASPTLAPLTKRQAQVWDTLHQAGALALTAALKLSGATVATLRRLEDRGWVEIAPQVFERDPYAHEQIVPTQPLRLTAEQSAALSKVTHALDRAPVGPQPSATSPSSIPLAVDRAGGAAQAQQPPACPTPATACGLAAGGPEAKTPVFLLHGVTGSGKTEVYLQALAHTLQQGKGAIVLVPEISLTPQTVERFKARFSTGPLRTLVAVLHSHLSAGERHDEWHKIRQGRARIVIGARSAVFAPVEPLGLLVVDEEHEHSYKQEEAPRYHARDVAVVRGQREGAVVVLGSATPSLESYANTQRGKYLLLELPTRVDDQKMPLVRVVDMRREARLEKAPPIFSRQLREAITRRLERREQVILFLNRRGYSTSLQCPLCGYVAGCPNCSVALTYHRPRQRLCCHICGHEAEAPAACPMAKCRNPAIRYAGFGTQRVEETLAKLFPKARIQRMDSDVLKRKEDYRRILGDFRTGKTDILVGTQMIAKGLHFPNVTLVGIVYADLGLHVPDFRAGERTFQLLTQVAGRAGRGDVEGEVIVQSLTPFHPAIQFARRHDFPGFYAQEIEFREQLSYPPLSRVALLTLKARNEEKVKFTADHLRRELDTALAGWKDVVIAGPAPAPLLRAESFYRHQIMLRARQMTRLSRVLAGVQQGFPLPEDVTLTIDIDPVNLV